MGQVSDADRLENLDPHFDRLGLGSRLHRFGLLLFTLRAFCCPGAKLIILAHAKAFTTFALGPKTFFQPALSLRSRFDLDKPLALFLALAWFTRVRFRCITIGREASCFFTWRLPAFRFGSFCRPCSRFGPFLRYMDGGFLDDLCQPFPGRDNSFCNFRFRLFCNLFFSLRHLCIGLFCRFCLNNRLLFRLNLFGFFRFLSRFFCNLFRFNRFFLFLGGFFADRLRSWFFFCWLFYRFNGFYRHLFLFRRRLGGSTHSLRSTTDNSRMPFRADTFFNNCRFRSANDLTANFISNIVFH